MADLLHQKQVRTNSRSPPCLFLTTSWMICARKFVDYRELRSKLIICELFSLTKSLNVTLSIVKRQRQPFKM